MSTQNLEFYVLLELQVYMLYSYLLNYVLLKEFIDILQKFHSNC